MHHSPAKMNWSPCIMATCPWSHSAPIHPKGLDGDLSSLQPDRRSFLCAHWPIRERWGQARGARFDPLQPGDCSPGTGLKRPTAAAAGRPQAVTQSNRTALLNLMARDQQWSHHAGTACCMHHDRLKLDHEKGMCKPICTGCLGSSGGDV